MKIKTIEIQNFQKFSEKKLNFQDDLSLIFGAKAGSGKTTIIEALKVGISSLFMGFDSINPTNIKSTQVYFEVNNKQINYQYPAQIQCTAFFNEKPITWSRKLNSQKGKMTRKNAREIKHYSQDIQSKIKNNENQILPLFVVYPVKRFWDFVPSRSLETLPPQSKFSGYEHYENPSQSKETIIRWWKTMKLAEKQNNKTNFILKEFTDFLIHNFIDILIVDWQITETQNELLIYFKNEKTKPIWALSNSYRSMIGLFLDIAYRCIMLNAHLKDKVFQQTPGVVLIDEIELYLDEDIQNKIIKMLQSAFPMIQFIITTHSSIVSHSVDSKYLIKLSN